VERRGGSSRSQAWRRAAEAAGDRIGQVVADLLTLADNDEACRLLGVEGALDGQLDVAFLNEPLEWIAFDLATALQEVDSDDPETASNLTLTVLVAELRLYLALRGPIDAVALEHRVREQLASRDR
jgi:hypothetical protein